MISPLWPRKWLGAVRQSHYLNQCWICRLNPYKLWWNKKSGHDNFHWNKNTFWIAVCQMSYAMPLILRWLLYPPVCSPLCHTPQWVHFCFNGFEFFLCCGQLHLRIAQFIQLGQQGTTLGSSTWIIRHQNFSQFVEASESSVFDFSKVSDPGPWKMWLKSSIRNFQIHIKDRYLVNFQWNWQMAQDQSIKKINLGLPTF